MNDEIVCGRRDDANKLVLDFHYSHHIPANIQFCTSLVRDGLAIASVFYSIPATRWKEPVLELCRLVRDETVEPKPTLSYLISKSIKTLKSATKFNLIISFADSSHGHHGGIYQACSWYYHTFRKPRIDGFIIDGIFVAARTCNHRYGTSSVPKLLKMFSAKGISCVPHLDTGKHLYWKPLDNLGKEKAIRLGLTQSSYPKPNIIKSNV